MSGSTTSNPAPRPSASPLRAAIPSVSHSLAAKLLPFVLASIAGSADVIGFLGLNGLFTAHVTGNLVILAAHIVAGSKAPLPWLLSVPVFIVALALTQLLAASLKGAPIAPLPVLLLLQFYCCAFSSLFASMPVPAPARMRRA